MAEVIIAVGISSVVVLGSSNVLIESVKAGNSSEKIFWLNANRLEFESTIKSQNGWNDILANNPNMACLAGASGCSAFANPQPLMMPLRGTVLNGNSNSLGMNSRGDFCNTYDPVNESAACPIGIKLSWQALCDDATCLHAQPKLNIQFQSKSLNGKSYDAAVFRDPKLESLSEVCASMGGTLIGMTCTIPKLGGACSPSTGSFALGFDNQGNIICGKPNPGGCSASDIAIGFNAIGNTVCAPACP